MRWIRPKSSVTSRSEFGKLGNMLDPRLFLDQIDVLEKGLAKKNFPSEEISKIIASSKRRKELIQETENLKAKRNAGSQQVGQLKAKAKSEIAGHRVQVNGDDRRVKLRGTAFQPSTWRLLTEQRRVCCVKRPRVEHTARDKFYHRRPRACSSRAPRPSPSVHPLPRPLLPPQTRKHPRAARAPLPGTQNRCPIASRRRRRRVWWC